MSYFVVASFDIYSLPNDIYIYIYISVSQILPLSPDYLPWRVVFSLFDPLSLASSGHEYSTTEQTQQSFFVQFNTTTKISA